MNDTSLANEISIRDLQLSRRSQGSLIDDLQRASREHWDRIQHQARQIHDLTQRLERLEKPEPQDTLNRRIKALDEKDHVYGLTKSEAEELDWLRKRISLMMAPATVEKPYTSPEGWDAKHGFWYHQQVARWLEAGRYRLLIHHHTGTFVATDESEQKTISADTLPRLADALMKWPEGASPLPPANWVKAPVWRDAKTNPPKADGSCIVCHGAMYVWDYNTISNRWTELGSPVYAHKGVTHWQELPAPPQATEKA